MKEVLFFSCGDSRNASTWSNVPFCFVKSLEKKGILVHTVNICPYNLLNDIFDLFLRRVVDFLFLMKSRSVYFHYSHICEYIGYRIIKKAIKQHPNVDLCFFIGYGFYNKYSNTPSILFGDWTTEQSFIVRKGVSVPYLWRRRCIQEENAITNAEYVISIFQNCAKWMKDRYHSLNIFHLGGNVINDLTSLIGWKMENGIIFYDDHAVDMIMHKKHAHVILFVGKPDRYKEGANTTISAFKLLKKEFPKLELHIIGMTKNDIGEDIEGVIYHGYLHKDKTNECILYYELLLNAKVIVNPTPMWAAYSSIIEAMYFYTPVIVSPFDEFVKDFGENISFGCYNYDFSVDSVAMNIRNVINNVEYQNYCLLAHEAVKDNTWDLYIKKILTLLT